MKNFESFDDVLNFAIKEEEAAARFYRSLSQKATNPGMRDALLGFAAEEEGHKAKLVSFVERGIFTSNPGKVTDLKIGDYLVEGEITGDIDYPQALVIAMRKEKAAYRLYMELAARVQDAAVKTIFQALAREEAAHKLRFETEYDQNVLIEN